MPKVKVKRKSTFIDMTAMSDVTVLLLTFFILTSTFVKQEPVQVVTPGSVSDIKIPETNIMTIIIDKTGEVYMSLDNQDQQMQVLKKVGAEYNINFTDEELGKFRLLPSFGVPIGRMKEFLGFTKEEQEKVIRQYKGIPLDSTNNQFKVWVKNAREINGQLIVAIKADNDTQYSTVKTVMNSLQDLKINRYNLLTSLKAGVVLPSEN